MENVSDEKDYKLGRLITLSKRFPKVPDSSDYPKLSQVVSSLWVHADRLSGLCAVPSYFVELALVTQNFACQSALTASSGRTVLPEKLTQKETSVARREFLKILNEFPRKDPRNLTATERRISKDWSHRMLTGLVAKMDAGTASGFESLLSSIIVNAWTTFESFSTDLWVEALNSNPKLAMYASLTNLPADNKGEEMSIENDAGKSVSIKQIDAYGYDLRGRMGLVLKASNKFNFNRLYGIEAAYHAAFGKKAKAVFDKPKYRRMTVLEGMRNVLVHSGGKIDLGWERRVKKDPAAFGKLGSIPRGHPLPIDGATINEFVRLCISICRDLLNLVNDTQNGKNAGDEIGNP